MRNRETKEGLALALTITAAILNTRVIVDVTGRLSRCQRGTVVSLSMLMGFLEKLVLDVVLFIYWSIKNIYLRFIHHCSLALTKCEHEFVSQIH